MIARRRKPVSFPWSPFQFAAVKTQEKLGNSLRGGANGHCFGSQGERFSRRGPFIETGKRTATN